MIEKNKINFEIKFYQEGKRFFKIIYLWTKGPSLDNLYLNSKSPSLALRESKMVQKSNTVLWRVFVSVVLHFELKWKLLVFFILYNYPASSRAVSSSWASVYSWCWSNGSTDKYFSKQLINWVKCLLPRKNSCWINTEIIKLTF